MIQNMTILNDFKQYSMFDLFARNENILYWKNVISYPDKFLEMLNELDFEILSYPRIESWKDWTASDDESLLYGKTKKMFCENVKVEINNKKIDSKTRYLINTLSMAFNFTVQDYFKFFQLNADDYNIDFSSISIRKWFKDSYMGPHSDGYIDDEKGVAYTIICYLNDDYEGGEIYFKNKDVLIKPQAGSLIIFPGTEIHEVKPVISGERYMATSSIYWK